MIRFGSTKPDGKKLIGIGLSAENISRLVKLGQPIVFDATSVGFEGEILILFGRNEEKLTEMVRGEVNWTVQDHREKTA